MKCHLQLLTSSTVYVIPVYPHPPQCHVPAQPSASSLRCLCPLTLHVPDTSVIPLYLPPLLFTTLNLTTPPPHSPCTSLSLAPSPLFSPPCLWAQWFHTHIPCLLPATFPYSVHSASRISLHQPCPHSCPLSFPLASPSSYPPHSPVSPGEKPYVCTVPGCGKRFTEYSSLYKHHVVHTHCKPYTCSTCGKTYRQTSTLAMHKRSAHGELEATEESEQALYEQQQLEGEGHGQEVRWG